MTPPGPDAGLETPALAWAAWLGERWAVTGAALLLLTMAAVALLLWVPRPLRRRLAQRWPADGRPAWAGLLLRYGLAGGTVLLAGAAVAELAEHLGPDSLLSRWDSTLTASVQQHAGPANLDWAAAVSHAGDPWVITLLAVLVAAWLWQAGLRHQALAWAVALAGNGLVTRALKLLLARVRPEHWHDLASAHGYAFPSGHSSASVVAYGWLAVLAQQVLPPVWRVPAACSLAALAVAVCLSRIVLQVHYASDVLAGMAVGCIWLVASVQASQAAGRAAATAAARATGPAGGRPAAR